MRDGLCVVGRRRRADDARDGERGKVWGELRLHDHGVVVRKDLRDHSLMSGYPIIRKERTFSKIEFEHLRQCGEVDGIVEAVVIRRDFLPCVGTVCVPYPAPRSDDRLLG